ncbi:phosphate ABC transporter substrate-binding protein [Erysipelotrichaceae bacterium]|nr:phosphate ABC transporter substrate-binding protein [Erysipelotrichaceae bacterium]
MKILKRILVASIACIMISACATDTTGNADIKGKIKIDGSATVAPVTQAVVEEYSQQYRNVEVTLGVSGTGGGFKKFINGETDVQNASRKIKDSEITGAEKNGVEYAEIEVGKDAIVFAVSNENNWAKNLTTEQLVEIWKEDSPISLWSDLDSNWPNEKIKLYAPASDAGTYDYFHSAVMGKTTKMRSDYTASQDSNVLVTGVAGDKYSLGFFGYVYYVSFADKLQAVAINSVEPKVETINSGAYQPLSRGLYIYINMNRFKESKALQEFSRFYLENAEELTYELGYAALSKEEYIEEIDNLFKKQ